MQGKRARLKGEEEEEGGENISYVFGEEVVVIRLDVSTRPLSSDEEEKSEME